MSKIVDKIKSIMEQSGLTSSIFADEVGVARASISHILAGRNKPSLPILVKIIKRFPEYGIDWILEEEPESQVVLNPQQTIQPLLTTPNPAQLFNNPSVTPSQPQTQKPLNSPTQPISTNHPPEKKIEKIMVFYTDRTFIEYVPNLQ